MKILVSVSDKTGLVDFINKLMKHYSDLEIISTSGTANYLKEHNINTIEVSDYTSFPEILNGRVKTLHPKIFGGILSKKDSNDHNNDIIRHNIKKIDMVICNLYEFEKVINSKNFDHDEAIENIDIGGSAILRAAAKNYSELIVLSDPSDYSKTIESIIKNKVTDSFKKHLAVKVFRLLSNYDNKISNYLNDTSELNFPKNIEFKNLRYGENPHQKGYIYSNNFNGGIANSKIIAGKKMSYNNYLDSDVAFLSSNYFEKNCVSVVKHTNVCGLSVNKKQIEAFKDSIKGDPISSFGGILGFNSEVEEEVANEIIKNFFEIIVAPKFSEESLNILKSKKNLRIIKANYKNTNELHFRSISGGLLAQSQNLMEGYDQKIVTEIKPSEKQFIDLKFAWDLSSFIKSNSILLVKNKTLLGMGAGQPNRIMSVQIAGEVAGIESNGSVLASDAFFPFPDSIIKAHELGIKCIIQPGGSINDEDVIKEANNREISMIFTGQRRFTH
tara:strand:- start:7530 stop:9029 length:1500 start_codon:yes stop_codon:yes gene_type:complete